jgi:hypothetical protein
MSKQHPTPRPADAKTERERAFWRVWGEAPEQGLITARAGCCETCTVAQLAVRQETTGLPEAARGYVIIGPANVAALAEGRPAYLEFGALPLVEGGMEDTLWRENTRLIGLEVYQRLRGAGLNVSWSGDARKRMAVEPDRSCPGLH